MCPQAKPRPCHGGWRAAGLLLLLLALAVAVAVAGGLLGFAPKPSKVSPRDQGRVWTVGSGGEASTSSSPVEPGLGTELMVGGQMDGSEVSQQSWGGGGSCPSLPG